MSEHLPVFRHDNLPGHRANKQIVERLVLLDAGYPEPEHLRGHVLVDWPVSDSGVKYMPMSGTYVVQHPAGSSVRTDGYLVVDEAGHPVWSAEPPA